MIVATSVMEGGIKRSTDIWVFELMPYKQFAVDYDRSFKFNWEKEHCTCLLSHHTFGLIATTFEGYAEIFDFN